MKITSVLLLCCFLVSTACKKDNRSCKCDVVEEGTVTTTSSIGIPPFMTVGNPSSAPYSTTTSAVYNFENVTKKDMNAACPAKVKEEINVTTVSSVNTTITIEIKQENVGERTKSCEIIL